MGHWLRDANAPQPDARKIPGAPSRKQKDGAPTARGGMSFRYTQGEGRRGERAEQLMLRTRFVRLVAEKIQSAPTPWWTWQKTTDSWDHLVDGPSADAEEEGGE